MNTTWNCDGKTDVDNVQTRAEPLNPCSSHLKGNCQWKPESLNKPLMKTVI